MSLGGRRSVSGLRRPGWEFWRGLEIPLAYRISVPVATLVTVVFAIHLSVNDPQRLLLSQKRAQARRLGRIVQAIVTREMIAGQPKNVQEHLSPLRRSGGIERILVLDREGVVRYGNESSEVGRSYSMEGDPECTACHDRRGLLPAEDLVLRQQGGRWVFSYFFSLENAEACRRCHDPRQDSLGEVLLDIPLDDADGELLSVGRRLATSAFVLVVLAVVGIYAISRVLVQRPIRALLEATQRIEGGDFSPDFPRPRRDELGRLNRAFQRMAQRLGALVERQEKEIQRRTRELEESQRMLLQQEKLAALGRMTAGVAHEIGNPIGAILSLSEVIEGISDEAEVIAECQEIRAQVDRVSRLVHDLTDSARPHSGQNHCRLDESVQTARRVVRLEGPRSRGVDFDVDLEPAVVGVACEHLVQVFVNLFLNAVDAMDGEGRIRIRARSLEDAIEVRVLDSGPGVAPEAASHLFEPFFTTKEPSRGTGLGLWICYNVLQRWGGTIVLAPSEGRGAEFVLRLPLAKNPGDHHE